MKILSAAGIAVVILAGIALVIAAYLGILYCAVWVVETHLISDRVKVLLAVLIVWVIITLVVLFAGAYR